MCSLEELLCEVVVSFIGKNKARIKSKFFVFSSISSSVARTNLCTYAQAEGINTVEVAS